MGTLKFGWLPPSQRTTFQQAEHERIVAGMPQFAIQGRYSADKGRFPLWDFGKRLFNGKHIKFSWQQTGSCVGSNGSNALRIRMAVEIMLGEPEEYLTLWWPYTYGQSRTRAGIPGEGDGSFGSAWAEAIRLDGSFAITESSGLPTFKEEDNWLILPGSVETEWSNGARFKNKYGELGRKHLIETASPIKSAEEAAAAIKNGYPLTCASMFGTKDITPKGDPVVNIGTWSDQWPHQQWFDEVWDHPTEGMIFRMGNDWGSDAHPSPTQGEPPGGFYITAKTFNQIASKRDSEIYALSKYSGFPARDIWYV